MAASTPKELGYYFPAEWHKHTATWLSWPHKEASWPGKIDTIYSSYCKFIKELTKGELVRINVIHEAMKLFAINHLQKQNVDLAFYDVPLLLTSGTVCKLCNEPCVDVNRHPCREQIALRQRIQSQVIVVVML